MFTLWEPGTQQVHLSEVVLYKVTFSNLLRFKAKWYISNRCRYKPQVGDIIVGHGPEVIVYFSNNKDI